MGNGPSLKPLLDENAEKLGDYDLIVVNDMGLQPEFMLYKPNIYVLCDPLYWLAIEQSEESNEKRLYEFLADNVTWQLQLYLPYRAKKTRKINEIMSKNPNILISYYNMTKVEGYKWFQYMMVKRQWGMFRAENVVVASILLAIYSEYKQINLMGVDFDGMKDLWIDETNRLRGNEGHFYGGREYCEIKYMHTIYFSLYLAHKSFFDIENYSLLVGVKIFNMNKYSFVNCFEKLPKLQTDNH
jgi:hypothetical protein